MKEQHSISNKMAKMRMTGDMELFRLPSAPMVIVHRAIPEILVYASDCDDFSQVKDIPFLEDGHLCIPNVDTMTVICGNNLHSSYDMFANGGYLGLNITVVDYGSLQDVGSMFFSTYANSVKVITPENAQIEHMECMFAGAKVETVDLSECDISKVTSMYRMFYQAHITNLYFPSSGISHINNIEDMFLAARIDNIITTDQCVVETYAKGHV